VWVFAKTGFLSIVAHQTRPKHLLVRSRFEGDIEAVFPRAQVEVTPAADYLYRAVIPKASVAARLAELARGIDYTSFKSSVPDERARTYLEVWSVMRLAHNWLSSRLFPKFDVSTDLECWIWTGAVSSAGYGVVQWDGRVRLAHRVIYELVNGELRDGLTVDHLCRNRACVNPSHLEAVTQRENVLRGESPAAENAIKSHCIRGHEFSESNTYHVQGSRRCRECSRIRAREGYHRRRARRAR